MPLEMLTISFNKTSEQMHATCDTFNTIPVTENVKYPRCCLFYLDVKGHKHNPIFILLSIAASG